MRAAAPGEGGAGIRAGRGRVLSSALMIALAAWLPGASRAAPATPAVPPPDYALLDGARGGRLLRHGARGPEVRALQRALVALGAALVADGIFGHQTLAAVRAFQARSGLAPDGLVGPLTVRALDRAFGLGGATHGGGGSTPPPAPSRAAIPARPPLALSGSAFLAATAGLSPGARDAAVLAEVLAGNVPEHLRHFVAVRWQAPDAQGRPRAVVLRVAPDVVSIGSDLDFVRMPMGAQAAQRIADAFGCSLPTRRLSDVIHRHAQLPLVPRPLAPGPLMTTNGWFAEHQRRIEAQRGGAPLGLLIAGHKKDIVISNRLLAQPDRVAIYGWHWPDGRPIQPLSTVHHAGYADYSHGVRLVLRQVEIDGALYDLLDVLRDPLLAPLCSDEGIMPRPRLP
ncbi:MAG: hypothetical protein KatS3mg102_1756 [Planctomycetota bacterium]|nr:MAG: hypothetical protein KatS3mg102_1756 [Planctomycetota bacterium]